ncbi:MAG: glycosyltransferase [Bacteroidota bacterium]
MKILHVIPTMDPVAGGVCQAVRTIIKHATTESVKHEVVCLDHPDSAYLKNEEFILHALGKGETAWNYNSELKPWLCEFLPLYDSVIVHGMWQYQTYAVQSSWKKLRSSLKGKLYAMPHGMLDPYFQRAKGRRFKAIRNLLFWECFEKPLVNTVEGMLFTCEEEKQLAQIPFRSYHPKKQFVVGLGVEEPPLHDILMDTAWHKKCPQIKDYNFLLFLSRIHPKKGVDLLINAYIGLPDNEKDARKLVIAGPGLNTSFGRHMVELAKPEKNIIFVDMLTGNEKWGAFYGCEAFILPSHQENFGISVVEAMACGKPVLITNQINIYREIQVGNAGLICEDNQAGVNKMLSEWLLLHDHEKRKFGDRAKFIYMKYFSPIGAAKALLSVLQEFV